MIAYKMDSTFFCNIRQISVSNQIVLNPKDIQFKKQNPHISEAETRDCLPFLFDKDFKYMYYYYYYIVMYSYIYSSINIPPAAGT